MPTYGNPSNTLNYPSLSTYRFPGTPATHYRTDRLPDSWRNLFTALSGESIRSKGASERNARKTLYFSRNWKEVRSLLFLFSSLCLHISSGQYDASVAPLTPRNKSQPLTLLSRHHSIPHHHHPHQRPSSIRFNILVTRHPHHSTESPSTFPRYIPQSSSSLPFVFFSVPIFIYRPHHISVLIGKLGFFLMR